MVKSPDDLRRELAKAYAIAVAGRMGPVLVDVPIDIQQMEVGVEIIMPSSLPVSSQAIHDVVAALDATLVKARRPVVLWALALDSPVSSMRSWLGYQPQRSRSCRAGPGSPISIMMHLIFLVKLASTAIVARISCCKMRTTVVAIGSR
jgi:hypothetical protein